MSSPRTNPDLYLITYRAPTELPAGDRRRAQITAFLTHLATIASGKKKIRLFVSAAFLFVASGVGVALVHFDHGSLKARTDGRKGSTLARRAQLPDRAKEFAIVNVPVRPRAKAAIPVPTSPEHLKAALPAPKLEMREVAAVRTRVSSREALRFSPPRPVKTVMPNLALFEQSVIARIKQTEIEVNVDGSGRVTAARVLNPDENLSAPLTAALIAAAKGWTFEPARIGDQNIPAKHTIVFHFRAF